MRVVLDTNVLISGLLNKEGAPGRILDVWRSGGFELVGCDALIEEFKRACMYPKLHRPLPPSLPAPQRRTPGGGWKRPARRQPSMPGPMTFRFLNETLPQGNGC